MRRVAITGVGIVSSIGNHVEEVTASLHNGTSGIVAAPEYTELGIFWRGNNAGCAIVQGGGYLLDMISNRRNDADSGDCNTTHND